MKIKEKLKKYEITLNEFAEVLNLSRPTLNTYINQFEAGDQIGNKNYQEIFVKLFGTHDITREKFEEVYQNLNFKANKDEYTKENREIMDSIIKKVKEDLRGKKETVALYKFINSAIHNYEKDKALTGYINYNLYLNGLKSMEKIKFKDKKLISNLFPVMKNYIDCKLKLNLEQYKKFKERTQEIELGRVKKQEELKVEIEKKIREEIERKMEQGLGIESIDIENILNSIKI
ncbi:MAG: hypothetical protein ACRCZO_14050 [Cetobacterium sp.]|uniref:hypothetical protein n=1 Tax=uncultured Cetobacterium sp. TaxID=527638 RepID=UPI0025F6CAC4|nr:hypothetical protein [uncultured Cetobacterium sp.]